MVVANTLRDIQVEEIVCLVLILEATYITILKIFSMWPVVARAGVSNDDV